MQLLRDTKPNPGEHFKNEQRVYKATNGYGASVVRGHYTYGGPDGLFELAVIKFDGEDWHLCYDTPITEDVIGHLSEPEVQELLVKIEALPNAS